MVIFLGMSAVVGEAYQGRKATLPWDVEEVETARNSERERESKKKKREIENKLGVKVHRQCSWMRRMFSAEIIVGVKKKEAGLSAIKIRHEYNDGHLFGLIVYFCRHFHYHFYLDRYLGTGRTSVIIIIR